MNPTFTPKICEATLKLTKTTFTNLYFYELKRNKRDIEEERVIEIIQMTARLKLAVIESVRRHGVT